MLFRSVSGAWKSALAVLVVGLLSVAGSGVVLASTFHHKLPTLALRLQWVGQRILGSDFGRLLGFGKVHGPHWADFLLSFLAAVVVLMALNVFLRSAHRTARPGDDLKVRRLLLEHPEDSLEAPVRSHPQTRRTYPSPDPYTHASAPPRKTVTEMNMGRYTPIPRVMAGTFRT